MPILVITAVCASVWFLNLHHGSAVPVGTAIVWGIAMFWLLSQSGDTITITPEQFIIRRFFRQPQRFPLLQIKSAKASKTNFGDDDPPAIVLAMFCGPAARVPSGLVDRARIMADLNAVISDRSEPCYMPA